jgi:hypothetical protein
MLVGLAAMTRGILYSEMRRHPAPLLLAALARHGYPDERALLARGAG